MKAGAVSSTRRAYRMRARADAAEQTALRIMDAAIRLWREAGYDDETQVTGLSLKIGLVAPV